MHDNMTVAFDIKGPFRSKRSKLFPKGHRSTLITIWHVDPEKDGDEDSCEWFNRTRVWWKHPRWHIHHWRFQVHTWGKFKRWAFCRCSKCGGRFLWNESVIGMGDSPEIWHFRCEKRSGTM